MPVFGFFLGCIFPHLDWIRRDASYLSVVNPNAGKYGPEKLRIRTHFTLCLAAKSCLLFLQSVSAYMFDRVLSTPLKVSWSKTQIMTVMFGKKLHCYMPKHGELKYSIFKQNISNAKRRIWDTKWRRRKFYIEISKGLNMTPISHFQSILTMNMLI